MKKSLFVLPALLMACGFEPEAGTYDLELTVVDNGCDMDFEGESDTGDAGDEGMTTDVELAEDGSTVTLDGEIVCARSGNGFTCEESEQVLDASADIDPEMEGIISFTQIMDAQWSDATSFDGDFSFAFVCEGADCEDVAAMVEMDLPCDTNGTFAASMPAAADAE
jgi:hypothetical protein